MPVYLLGKRNRSIEIPDQPISVAMVEPHGAVELVVTPGDGHGDDAQQVVRIGAQAVVIPSLAAPCTVAVRPVGDATFEHGTAVRLVIGPDVSGSADGAELLRVTLDPVDVSGCRSVALAELTPKGGRIEVTVVAVDDTELSPLAAMARTAARRCAGSRRVPAGGGLSVGVDTSASMWWSFQDGSVAAAIDLIVGVADAVDIRDVGVVLVGAECTPVTAEASQLAEAVAHASPRWSAGARWSRFRPPAGRAIRVTDATNRSAVNRPPTLYLSSDPRLAGLGPILTPPPAAGAQRHLMDNPSIVDEVSAQLFEVIACAADGR